MPMVYSLAELQQVLGAELQGDPDCKVTGLAPIDKANSDHICVLHNIAYRKHLSDTSAAAVVLSADDRAHCSVNALIVANPYLAYAKLANLFATTATHHAGIHPTAVVGVDCQIDATVSLGPRCVIGDRVTIGANTIVQAGSVIEDDVVIGSSCLLHANVTCYRAIQLADRVIIHSGVVIGADGFGLAQDKGVWHKIPQLGSVVIGNDVEIGANTTIDRGALENTVIEQGVKIDNLVQIAHNVHIGAHTVIAGCVGIAGSSRIGKHCMLAGSVGVAGHLEIADQVIVTAASTVGKSITEAGVYSGNFNAQPDGQWRRIRVRLQQLDDMAKKLKKLENLCDA